MEKDKTPLSKREIEARLHQMLERSSERLTKALNKYRNQALTNAEVIEELIRMAHDIKKMRDEEAELGLSEDEIAFYDALTANDIVRTYGR